MSPSWGTQVRALSSDTQTVSRSIAEAPRSEVLDVGEAGLINAALETGRELLGMDLAYLADTRAGLLDYHALAGDHASFGAQTDEPVSLEGTYCELLITGRLDGPVLDAEIDARVAGLPITQLAGSGCCTGVSVHLPDGSLYGTLCCLWCPTRTAEDYSRVAAETVEAIHASHVAGRQ